MKYSQPVLQILRSPLLWTELVRFLRSGRSFLTLFVFLTGLLYVIAQNWVAFTSHWAPDRDTARGARELFLALAKGHLILITLVTPFLTAPAVSQERENSTIELLFSSPISTIHILLSKLISPLLFMLLLLISASPALSVCFWGGGLDIGEVSRTYLILLTATFTYGCMGILCSTLRPKVYEVYLLSAGALLFFAFLLPYHGSIWEYLSSFNWYGSVLWNHGLQYFSPFFALGNEFQQHEALRGVQSWIPDLSSLLMSGSWTPLNYATGTYISLSAVSSLIFLTAAFWQLRRISKSTSFQWKSLIEEEEEEEIRYHERDDVFSFDKTSEDGNPGIVLERRVQWFAKLPVLIRLFYCSLMISIFTLPLASYNGSWLFLSLPFVSAAMFTLPLSATSISSDRERGLLDLIRTSLLSSRQIIRAKFYANLQYSFLIALALYLPGMSLQVICGLLGYEVDLVTNSQSIVAIVLYPIILFFALVFYTAYGLYCSAVMKRTNRALLLSGAVILSSLIIPFLIPYSPSSVNSTLVSMVTLLVSLISPLAGVISLYPLDNINLKSGFISLMQSSSILFGIAFVAAQCVLCLLGTAFLLKRAESKLNYLD